MCLQIKGEQLMTDPAKLEQEALKAAGFNTAAANMEKKVQQEDKGLPAPKEVPQMPEVKDPPKEKEQEQEEKVYTLDEKMEIVCQIVQQRFPGETNIPTLDHLKKWRAQHGNVFFLDLGGKDIFLYRYVKRIEYTQLINDKNWNALTDDEQEEKIVDRCLLWPAIPDQIKAFIPAGKIKMLSEQIMTNSMFLSAQQLAMSTIKL